MILWAAGARQARDASVWDRDHRALYDAGLLLRIDTDRDEVTVVREDRTRTGFGAAYKGLARAGDALLISQEGAVLELVDGAVTREWSDPRFNDVHHAIEHDGTRVVASTGTDGVVVGDRFVPVAVGAGEPADDVRTRDLGPRRSHPNHLFVVDGRVFVTRGVAGDAVSLDGTVRWPLASVVVHDGVVRPDGVWFTAVDGRLLRVDPTTGSVDREVRLGGGPEPLGWCRGLAFDADVAWVGFTQIRSSRMRRNLAWIRGAVRGRQDHSHAPTRLVAVSVATGQPLHTIELHPHGIDALFGIVGAPGDTAA